MFRVSDVSRCHPPRALATPIAQIGVQLLPGLVEINSSRRPLSAVHGPFKNHNFLVLLECNQCGPPNANGNSGLVGQPVKH
jgi:hypothetical protein